MTVDDSDPEDRTNLHSPGASPGGAQPAALRARFAARLIDSVIVLVFAVVVAVLLGEGRHLYVIATVFGVAGFAYFTAFESARGWTPGKRLMGLQVCGPGAAPVPTVRQAAVRNAFTLLVVLPFVGGVLALTAYLLIASTIGSDPNRQGVHDRRAGGTSVVRNRLR